MLIVSIALLAVFLLNILAFLGVITKSYLDIWGLWHIKWGRGKTMISMLWLPPEQSVMGSIPT
jgi:hypothetical protein